MYFCFSHSPHSVVAYIIIPKNEVSVAAAFCPATFPLLVPSSLTFPDAPCSYLFAVGTQTTLLLYSSAQLVPLDAFHADSPITDIVWGCEGTPGVMKDTGNDRDSGRSAETEKREGMEVGKGDMVLSSANSEGAAQHEGEGVDTAWVCAVCLDGRVLFVTLPTARFFGTTQDAKK